MRIEQRFTVQVLVDACWAAFQDVPGVTACLPGAEIVADHGDGSFDGRMTVRLGPLSLRFEGRGTLVADPAARTATLEGRGVDKRGGSRGQASVHYRLEEAEGGRTSVALVADVTLAGPAAQFGRTSIIEGVAARLIADFVACLEAKLAAATPEEAAAIHADAPGAISLVAGSIGDALRRRRDRA